MTVVMMVSKVVNGVSVDRQIIVSSIDLLLN
jgi:hypothetical protein